MKLINADVKKLPPMRSSESVPLEHKLLRVKFFDPAGRGTWFAAEWDGKDECFGYVVSPLGPDCDEWGYFSISELASVRNRLGLGIERDMHFKPCTLAEVQR